jgi:hypothetical protein
MNEYREYPEIESLLYEDESPTLDFKKEQYLFNKATDIQKSELLKDILAFANAWRRADAYILIGVEEVKGKKSNVIGINDDLDDASLQQFVNSKTQRPITFEYRSAILEDKRIGVIKIPLQIKPIYLKADYGKLKANIVYIRRGSSTAEADPDEIARMGTAIIDTFRIQPDFNIEFAQNKRRIRLGNEFKIETIKLLVSAKKGNYPFMPRLGHINKDFYRDLIEYYFLKSLVKKFSFYIENVSESPALGIKIEMKIPKSEEFSLLNESQMPSEPSSSFDYPRINMDIYSNNAFIKEDSTLSETADYWIIEIEIPRLQPKSSYFTQKSILVIAEKNLEKEFQINIYSDNLATPIEKSLLFKAIVIESPGDLETVKAMHYRRMRERAEQNRK